MDIQNLREVLTPEAWQTLQKHFVDLLKEVLVELEKKFQQDLASPLPAKPSPALLSPVAVKTPPKQPLKSGGRSLELPPPLDPSTLAYIPKAIVKLSRRHDAVAYRRDFIKDALLEAKFKGASEEEIFDHLVQAKFPVNNAYYSAPTRTDNRPRIWTSIRNDLTLFLKNRWVKQLPDGRWRWVRSGSMKA
jgi:hypothetical protein